MTNLHKVTSESIKVPSIKPLEEKTLTRDTCDPKIVQEAVFPRETK
jgi:hypothetical protein